MSKRKQQIFTLDGETIAPGHPRYFEAVAACFWDCALQVVDTPESLTVTMTSVAGTETVCRSREDLMAWARDHQAELGMLVSAVLSR